MQKEVSASIALGDVMRRHATQGETYLESLPSVFEPSRVFLHDRKAENEARTLIQNAAVQTMMMMRSKNLPSERQAEYRAFYNKYALDHVLVTSTTHDVVPRFVSGTPLVQETENIPRSIKKSIASDQIFSFEASFKGFVISLVDSEPSEIAVATLRSVEAVATWNALRTNDAIVAINVGWLQLDNHCPGAPYPVAICPDSRSKERSSDGSDTEKDDRPFLSIRLAFAPKHSSGIAVSSRCILYCKSTDSRILLDRLTVVFVLSNASTTYPTNSACAQLLSHQEILL